MELVKIENNDLIEIKEDILVQLANFEMKKIQMDILQKQLKEELKEAMENRGMKNFTYQNDIISIEAVYKKPTTRKTVDSKRLKSELPEIYEEYSKTSDVKSSITLNIEV